MPVLMPDGKPYTNTDECWTILTEASKFARYLCLVPIDAFEDRRNPEPILYMPEKAVGLPHISVYSGDLRFFRQLKPFDDISWPSCGVFGVDPVQRYHLEIWCESQR
jgi:hypothetical protein